MWQTWFCFSVISEKYFNMEKVPSLGSLLLFSPNFFLLIQDQAGSPLRTAWREAAKQRWAARSGLPWDTPGSLLWFAVKPRGCSVITISASLFCCWNTSCVTAFASQQRSCLCRGLFRKWSFGGFFVMVKWLTAKSIASKVEQAVSHRHSLGSVWGKVIWNKKIRPKRQTKSFAQPKPSPNSLFSKAVELVPLG